MKHDIFTYDENGDIQQPRYCTRIIDGNEYICRFVSQNDSELLANKSMPSFDGILSIVLPSIILFIGLVLFAPRPYGHPIAALILSVFLLLLIAALKYDELKSQKKERDEFKGMANKVIPLALVHAPNIDVKMKVINYYN